MSDNRGAERELVQVKGAADRAGSIVTEQVQSIMEAAETSAEQVRTGAEQDAEEIRRDAVGAALRVLDQLETVKTPLGDLAAGLRREVDVLNNGVDRRRDH
jgi:hypothetical protein